MAERETRRAIGATLRSLPIGRFFSNAFDFIADDRGSDADSPASTADAIHSMRAAANRLSAVADTVIVRAELTTRQVIDQATDEAAAFDG